MKSFIVVGKMVTDASKEGTPYQITWTGAYNRKPKTNDISQEDTYLVYYQMKHLGTPDSERYAFLDNKSWNTDLSPAEEGELLDLERKLEKLFV